jgi:translation initiation factor IF-2
VLEAVGEAKVGDDDVAVAVEEQVLELEVSVDDLLLVDVPVSSER